MDPLFPYILCFSSGIYIEFDPFLYLVSLGTTNICTSPASGQQSKRFSAVDTYTSVVSRAASPLYRSRYWTKQPKDFSVFQTCQNMGRNEATITALGLLCIFPKVSSSSAPCNLQCWLWFTDSLAPSVHLWCAGAAVKESAHRVTSPSLVLQGERQWPSGPLTNAHVWLREECACRGGVGAALFPQIRLKINV